MRFLRNFVFMLTILLGIVVGAGIARADTYEPWQFRNGQICVQYNGTFWPTATAVGYWNRSDINVVVKPACYGYSRKMIVVVKTYSSSAYECAKTGSANNDWSWEYVTYNGVKRATWVPNQMTVWLNVYSGWRSSCFATSWQRAHVISHELGHAFGEGHRSGNSVMASWAIYWPTSGTYGDIWTANKKY